ncbi:hypothetical protein [Flavobacterium sp.]|uniref:hypothetical protein n=1 Tax=Flavobacterium sp. TaxID=239 RepID=UPI0039E5491E
MKKTFLLFAFSLCTAVGFSQTDKAWTGVTNRNLKASKHTERLSFPTEFQLMRLEPQGLMQTLQNAPARNVSIRQNGVIISLPNIEGKLERFEMLESLQLYARTAGTIPKHPRLCRKRNRR